MRAMEGKPASIVEKGLETRGVMRGTVVPYLYYPMVYFSMVEFLHSCSSSDGETSCCWEFGS